MQPSVTYDYQRTTKGWLVIVHPTMLQVPCPPVIVILTDSQFDMFKDWLGYGGNLKEYLPELNAAAREGLLTGIGPDYAYAL